MTMVGVSATSPKGMQFESTKEVYYGVEAQLINLTVFNELDYETEEIIDKKLEEVEEERYKLSTFGATQLAMMAKQVEKDYQAFVQKLKEEGKL